MARVTTDNPKQQAHELIERLTGGQAAAVVGLLSSMLDPVDRALANAPLDDEPVSDDEFRDIAEERASSARDQAITNDEVLAEFGLSPDDFHQMGRSPLKAETIRTRQ
jgi:hypothetical protein